MTPEHAQPVDLPSAFGLIFRHLREEEQLFRTGRTIELIEKGELDGRGVFVLRDGIELASALVCSMVAGNGSLIWPPGIAAPISTPPVSSNSKTPSYASPAHNGKGVRLTQGIIPPGEEPLTAPLLRNGFSHVTGLAYMEHSFSLGRWLFSREEGVRYEPYQPEHPDEFHRTLGQGLRVHPRLPRGQRDSWYRRGHSRTHGPGPIRPEALVRSLRVTGRAAGVSMLIEMPESGDWELAYMGIVPEFRRRRLGRDMLFHALREARMGAERRGVCVDDRNTPAVRLYQSAGFSAYDRRAVFLAIW